MHRRTSPRRNQDDSQHPPQHNRRHIVSLHDQHSESSRGTGPGGHHHRAVGGDCQIRSQTRSHDLVARRTSKYRAQGGWWRWGGCPDWCCCRRNTEWCRVDGLSYRYRGQNKHEKTSPRFGEARNVLALLDIYLTYGNFRNAEDKSFRTSLHSRRNPAAHLP